MRHAGDDAEVVGDQQHSHAAAGLEFGQQRQHLRLDGHVEGGGGLVGDQQFRFAGERHRDHHALFHAAGELERIGIEALGGIRDADRLQQPPALAPGRGTAQSAMYRQHLADLLGHRHHRVEAGGRLLEDHPDAATAHRAHRRLAQRQQLLAVEAHAAGGDASAIGQQPHQRQRGHRLAAAGFAEQREGLAGAQRQIDAVHRPDVPERDPQPLDFEQHVGRDVGAVIGMGRGEAGHRRSWRLRSAPL